MNAVLASLEATAKEEMTSKDFEGAIESGQKKVDQHLYNSGIPHIFKGTWNRGISVSKTIGVYTIDVCVHFSYQNLGEYIVVVCVVGSKISKQNRIKYFSTWMGAVTAASAAEAAASELALKEKVNLG